MKPLRRGQRPAIGCFGPRAIQTGGRPRTACSRAAEVAAEPHLGEELVEALAPSPITSSTSPVQPPGPQSH